MKQQQFILIGGSVLLFCLIYFFGRTTPEKKPSEVAVKHQSASSLNFDSVLTASRQKLSPAHQEALRELESNVVRGDVKNQQINVYRQLAAFWKDSAHALLPYAYYSSEAAKLENSEKSLTFAAHFYLDGVRAQGDPAIRNWMANEAKTLFEQALVLNPSNDSLKIGLGSCYLFGNISDNPMTGITLIREVTERDSTNMYAQMMLATGGMISGQYDRAIERLKKVVDYQPRNTEALVMLAEACERHGDKAEAVKWYKEARKIIEHPEINAEIDKKIAFLSN